MAQKVANLAGSLATKGPKLVTGAVTFAKPRLQTFWKYAKVEMMPPTPAEFPQVQQGFQNLIKSAKNGKWKTVTVKEGFLNACITAEIFFWFFAGEVIGRGSLLGYAIPGAVHYDAVM
ncbi:ATP synthase F(0) complex subunit g, mitochondrial-like [Tubulanus polymorphus]|uniref:ATP synthase F(0) complex subunit g, mitochondrial-like n=1 Tax=Tubulanus polymorphus TaxID=672921 RepID=UPI003DA27AC5